MAKPKAKKQAETPPPAPLSEPHAYFIDGHPDDSDEELARKLNITKEAVAAHRTAASPGQPRSRVDASFHRTTGGGKTGGFVAMTQGASEAGDDALKFVGPPPGLNEDKWHRIK